MKQARLILIPLILLIFAVACSPRSDQTTSEGQGSSAENAVDPTQGNPAGLATETAIPTPIPELTPTPSPTPAPINFNADNFSQFVQLRSYYTAEINQALGGDLLEMSMSALAYSPDGRYIALGGCTQIASGPCNDAGSGESFLLILDAQTTKIVSRIPTKGVSITSLAFTSDGEKLIYAVFPARVLIWDITSGQVDRVVWDDGEKKDYPKIAVSSDGSMIAAAYLNRLLVWDGLSGELITEETAVRIGSTFPKFSFDGSRLAVFSAEYGTEITVYDTATWEKISSIHPPGNQTEIVAFSPDGKTIATAGYEEYAEILLWDVDSGAREAALVDTLKYVETLTFTPDGKLLLIAGVATNTLEGISVWDYHEHRLLGYIADFMFPSRYLFSADGSSFITNDYVFPILYLWSLPDAEILAIRQTVVDFLDALNQGDYLSAAALFDPNEEDLAYFDSFGLDTANIPSLLEALCTQGIQPCLQVKDIPYLGIDYLNGYNLMVRFTAPDGSIYVDPFGESISYIFVTLDAAGGASVSLPSYLFPTE